MILEQRGGYLEILYDGGAEIRDTKWPVKLRFPVPSNRRRRPGKRKKGVPSSGTKGIK